jgi:hypothetical protein
MFATKKIYLKVIIWKKKKKKFFFEIKNNVNTKKFPIRKFKLFLSE